MLEGGTDRAAILERLSTLIRLLFNAVKHRLRSDLLQLRLGAKPIWHLIDAVLTVT